MTSGQPYDIINIEREVNNMSYSPFAVLGTMSMIKANREKLNKHKSTEEEKEEEKEVDYTEQLRKTYFPHLVSSK